ncbi:hypothetical protein C8Q72DRAFT_793775 [Fomitopsis betulina]|nr:hypothetical protein C8Q72DRAFT_793775 [Fomitopsis betulina]
MPSNGGASSHLDRNSAASTTPSRRSNGFAYPCMPMNSPGVLEISVGPGGSPPTDFISFVDKVANRVQLAPKFSAILHDYKDTHWEPLVFQAALSLSVLQKLEHVRDHVQEVHTVTTNVQTQIVNHHTLTEDHEAEVTALCKRLVVQANWIDYDFADDVLETLKANQHFNEVFDSAAWTETLEAYVKRRCSYTRNAYRRHLRDAVLNAKKRSGLTACARAAFRKFHGGLNSHELQPEFVIHVALLCRFVREHPALLDCEEQDTADGWSLPTGTGGVLPLTQINLTSGKRSQFGSWKGIRNGGGYQVWSMGRSTELGTHTLPRYIDECIALERCLFPEDRIGSIAQRTTAANSAPPRLSEFTFTVPTVSRSPSDQPLSSSSAFGQAPGSAPSSVSPSPPLRRSRLSSPIAARHAVPEQPPMSASSQALPLHSFGIIFIDEPWPLVVIES